MIKFIKRLLTRRPIETTTFYPSMYQKQGQYLCEIQKFKRKVEVIETEMITRRKHQRH